MDDAHPVPHSAIALYALALLLGIIGVTTLIDSLLSDTPLLMSLARLAVLIAMAIGSAFLGHAKNPNHSFPDS